MLATANPFSIIIFGASGHLATLKLYPALFILALKNRMPEQYNVIGFSRSEMDESAFKDLVADSVRANIPEANEKILTEFLSHVRYHQGQYDDEKDYSELGKKMDEWEKEWKDNARLAYFSVPPEIFPDVSVNLCKGAIYKANVPMRCIVEKPVGGNLKSFEATKKQLLGCFTDEEIYLLDHYLGKEAVRNVYYLRYANPVLERLFENSLIHHVEITAAESDGIEGRAGYFEHTGTFRDMFQSHMLMIASLLMMDAKGEDNTFREVRANALKQLYLPPADDLGDLVLQAQYEKGTVNGEEVPGYREEEGIDPASRTNTFAALRLLSRASSWQGVPFYLRSGKRLEEKETRISIQFQVPQAVGEGSKPNCLHIILQGEAGMRFELQTKLGGTEPIFRPLILEDPLVCMGDCLPEHGLLLLEAMHGKKQWYLTFEEVQSAWRLLDPIQAYLEKDDTPLYMYSAGSKGPKEANDWIAKDNITWMDL